MHSGSADQSAGEMPAPVSTTPSITFESLTFSDGTIIELDRDDIVLFVGPNNAGKSVALRDLEDHVGPPVQGTVVKSAKLRRIGTIDDLRTTIRAHSQVFPTIRATLNMSLLLISHSGRALLNTIGMSRTSCGSYSASGSQRRDAS